MGMLTAVEMWTRRDHKAEWAQWESWLGRISERVKGAEGVTTRVVQPDSLSNHAPTLHIEWDAAKLGITGREVAKHLLDTDPRIILGGGSGSRGDDRKSSVWVMPYMMMPGDDKIAAERLYDVLSKPPRVEAPAEPSGAPATVSGVWDVEIQYLRGVAHHSVTLQQTGADLTGKHNGEFVSGDVHGSVKGDQVHFRAVHHIEGTELYYTFTGRAESGSISGKVNLGEYGEAQWNATRRA
jgi:hypothetical protein